MSQYKVPQDVEADDKLIGPFSFRQFIYLIIVALAGGLAWGLAQLFIPLAIIPLPVILLFGALALPLRKDQPMEIYLAAVISYFLKPHQRLWDPDGIDSLIEITVPKTVEYQRTKDLTQNEAQRRFSYLAEIVDTQGWSVRGVGVQNPDSYMKPDAYFDAQQTHDILDESNPLVKNFDQKLDKSTIIRQQNAIKIVNRQPVELTQPIASQSTTDFLSNYFSKTNPNTNSTLASDSITNQKLEYNPYPDIQQSVINPLGEQLKQKQPTNSSKTSVDTSEKVVPTGIINLANNPDLSIETIAREANRIQEKQDLTEEVVISLR